MFSSRWPANIVVAGHLGGGRGGPHLGSVVRGPMVGTLGIKGAAQACLGLFGLDFGQMLGPSGEAQIVALGFVRRKTNLSALREW